MTATVTPASLKRMLHDGQEPALLDLREEGQFALPAVTNPLYSVAVTAQRCIHPWGLTAYDAAPPCGRHLSSVRSLCD